MNPAFEARVVHSTIMNLKKQPRRSDLLDQLVAKAQRLGELWYRNEQVEANLMTLNRSRKFVTRETRCWQFKKRGWKEMDHSIAQQEKLRHRMAKLRTQIDKMKDRLEYTPKVAMASQSRLFARLVASE